MIGEKELISLPPIDGLSIQAVSSVSQKTKLRGCSVMRGRLYTEEERLVILSEVLEQVKTAEDIRQVRSGGHSPLITDIIHSLQQQGVNRSFGALQVQVSQAVKCIDQDNSIWGNKDGSLAYKELHAKYFE